MEFWAVFIMFICLCVDNMVMANMSAMKPQNNDVRSSLSLRISLSFSIFHVLFFLVGYGFAALLKPYPHTWIAGAWIAFAFILLIGIRLLMETVEKSPSFSVADKDMNPKLLKTSALLALNSLMIGFAMCVMAVEYQLFWPAFSLFAISMIMSMIGFLTGKPESKKISSKIFESIAGLIMIVLAVRILLTYY
ncbi:putative membrane protein [Elusimicrobium minutum Pei191]|uniref:Putative membrane protein n=1 Tax=Elusimicrobium minutum (strain Pei191) TaxID=445932 RepID=B2KEC9_ELUMP|nr:manganese efflux pump [Elusimicrobium minutum]ACC98875.1 putative membrane protein [Elusimicrobium minutum Pei191]